MAHESPQLAVRDQAGPVVDVPVADVVWQLVVPDGMRVVRSGGSVEVPGGGGEPWPLTDLAGVLVPMGGGVRAFSWMPLMESALPQAEMPALVATMHPCCFVGGMLVFGLLLGICMGALCGYYCAHQAHQSNAQACAPRHHRHEAPPL